MSENPPRSPYIPPPRPEMNPWLATACIVVMGIAMVAAIVTSAAT